MMALKLLHLQNTSSQIQPKFYSVQDKKKLLKTIMKSFKQTHLIN